MKHAFMAAVAVLIMGLDSGGPAAVSRADSAAPAPEFTHPDPHDWINSAPLSLHGDLTGRVVLIDVWAFECWNCYRSFAWLNALQRRLADQAFTVVGVHSPELEREKDHARLIAKVHEFGLSNPVMADNDHSYWNALGNRYWPAWYLIDRQGQLRATFVGETHEDDAQAQRIEQRIRQLLAESA